MRKIMLFLVVLLTFGVFFGFVTNAFAVNPNRTYSIGCKYVGGEHDGDNFTENVNNAYANYSRMSNYYSLKSTMPSVTGMKSLQDSGLRMIGHKVVFLNGHGNCSCIVF